MSDVARDLLRESATMRDALKELNYPQDVVAFVYHPLDYAWKAHVQYIERFANAHREVVFLGMNPGPFGMAQTGVPFGEIAAVRDWMGIQTSIDTPEKTHPKRPIQGFECQRSEVSGRRLWGLFSEQFDSAEHFFQKHFVLNYCPLLFVAETGRNVTPDKLPADVRAQIEVLCDVHLKKVLEILNPKWSVGVGGYAETRLLEVSAEDAPWTVTRVLHPSPASPAANRDWAGTVTKQLLASGVWE